MSTAPTGTDVSAVYTTQALVAFWLPDSYITNQASGAGTSNVKGKVSIDDLTRIMRDESRKLDAELWAAGLRSPFPAASDAAAVSGGPSLPSMVEQACSYRVASEVRAIMKMGSRGSPNSEELEARATAIVDALKKEPRIIGNVRVSTPEQFHNVTAGSGTSESGRIQSNWYRLANRGVIAKSVRFVRLDGATVVEAFNANGLPFIYGRDWTLVSPEQGILAICNSAIVTAIGSTGGVCYDWTWARLDRNCWTVSPLGGVQR